MSLLSVFTALGTTGHCWVLSHEEESSQSRCQLSKVLHYEEETLDQRSPCFPLAQHHRPGLGTQVSPKFHTAIGTTSRYLPQPSWNTLPLFYLTLSILVLTHLTGRRGQSQQAEVSAKQSPKSSSIIPLLSPQAGKGC